MGFGKVLHRITRAFEKMEVIVKVLNKKENNLFKTETLNFLSAFVSLAVNFAISFTGFCLPKIWLNSAFI